MAMRKKIGRLFQIRPRLEAWLVIYAVALGAVERGRHYLETYPGWGGWLLAVACTAGVFVAGGKLLDSVSAPAAAVASGPYRSFPQRRTNGRNRPTRLLSRRGSEARISTRRG